MSNLSELIAELEGKLRTLYPTIGFGLGEKDLSRNDLGMPRIVWIPSGAKHEPPSKHATNPRRLLTRAVSVVAHCWAVDPSDNATPWSHLDVCEALVHNLIVSLHETQWGSIEFGGEVWGQPDQIDFGHAALVTFIPKIPVAKQAYRTVQAKELAPEVRDVAPGDTFIDWSEP